MKLCSYIEKSSKLRKLKLSNNNLTDLCMKKLFDSFVKSKVTILTLSKNKFSEKCL